ncbi:MAG: hypothetical protein H6842_03420 [Rhodospirillaceae bacterium]|nr:hypothetical protein [Rhodospirillaceae bacterium]
MTAAPVWGLRVATDAADGAGHAVRCAALAAALPGRVQVFVDPGPVPAPLRVLPDCVAEAAPSAIDRLADAVAEGDIAAIIVDSYRVDETAIAGLAAQRPCAVFRDGAPRRAEAVAIDPSPTAEPREGYLCGPGFAPLAPEIRAARARLGLRPPPGDRRAGRLPTVLVAFGARDSADLTGRTLGALAPLAHRLDLIVVLGAAAPHLAGIRRQVDDLPKARLYVDHGDMAGLYAASELAIGAPGVSQLERLCLGVPTVLLAQTETHRPLVAAWVAAGVAMAPEDGIAGLAGEVGRLIADPDAAYAIAHRGQSLVDGDGAGRLAAALTHSLGLKEAA